MKLSGIQNRMPTIGEASKRDYVIFEMESEQGVPKTLKIGDDQTVEVQNEGEAGSQPRYMARGLHFGNDVSDVEATITFEDGREVQTQISVEQVC
mmetsp:Transcript_12300/g.23902  ORF Transcript_12300/g.23902 Transcript_12300/m.23902 type:complete len:95 (-) Transcript_12300:161-445(-)|eukprot:CAMPEP_0171489310 /NCGR_PEP_ID=MMETSP0958-20121227/2689_1 /TAXON_ID=87120 /ORGANISM="Aurantiochytrium limacinum, Strain ATCCMYA-1381" /LENGTH=94 /DNA_ID=CAMNT_0012022515 /DNA_START=115 /DNA_END=399 /DNA_ORIENTATION=+